MTEPESPFDAEQHARLRLAFVEGVVSSLHGGGVVSNVMETSAGPVEGRQTPDGTVFDTIKGEFLVQASPDGSMVITRYGRLEARMGPAELELEDPVEPDDKAP